MSRSCRKVKSNLETNLEDKTENDELTTLFKEELTEELKKLFLAFVFDDAKRKCGIFQSSQRRNIFHYPRRSSTQQTNETNLLPKRDSCEGMPSSKILNEIKLDRELESLIDTYNTAIKSLQQNGVAGQWENLFSAIVNLRQDEGKVLEMEQEFKTNKARLKELRLNLEMEREKWRKRLQTQDENIANLRYNLRNVRNLNDLEYNLVQRWEKNRHAQAAIVGENAESVLKQQISHYKHQLVAENCRFRTTLQYLGVQMEDYKKSIELWQKNFDNELTRCDAKNKAQVQCIFELTKLHEKQRLVYEQRVQFVEADMAQKAEEQQMLMQEMRRIQSAVQIQAWWRGTMVRRGLGPFRKKSKKSKKSKAK